MDLGEVLFRIYRIAIDVFWTIWDLDYSFIFWTTPMTGDLTLGKIIGLVFGLQMLWSFFKAILGFLGNLTKNVAHFLLQKFLKFAFRLVKNAFERVKNFLVYSIWENPSILQQRYNAHSFFESLWYRVRYRI